MENTITAEWLYQNKQNKNVIILDTTMVSKMNTSFSNYQQNTISGSLWFDLKSNFSDTTSSYPNTFPSESKFTSKCQKLGINKDSIIITFDNLGIYTSARVWWMFKVMGHKNVAVLDGGLPAWIDAGFEIGEMDITMRKSGNFEADLKPSSVKTYKEIQNNLSTESFLLVDARSEGRFLGTAEEPRKHLQSGHIEGAINIPFQSVLENGKFKSKGELQAMLTKKITVDKELVFSCGSGVTACIVLLAYDLAFGVRGGVYDGSWTEWAERQGLVKE